MPRKSKQTPDGMLRSWCRGMTLKCRERSQRLKMDSYTCQECGAKASRKKNAVVKVEVHHVQPIEWKPLLEEIRRTLLVGVEGLITLCKDCHRKK